MSEGINRMLDQKTDDRDYAGFRPELLNAVDVFTPFELSRIRTIFPKRAQLSKQQKAIFFNSLAFASSRLEGNSYTEIDASTLLDDGISCAKNTPEETKMLLNHKDALNFLVQGDQVDRGMILQLHSSLADDSGVEGSEHFLGQEFLGKVRTYDEVTISNTRYHPMVDYPGRVPTISDHLDTIIKNTAAASSPLEKAFYLFTRLPYLQAFRDCNKRTSRLVGNLPLLMENEYPISFTSFTKPSYNRSMIAFYEFGDTELFKAGFIEDYLHSAIKYHYLPRKSSEAIRSVDSGALRRDLLAFVVDGKSSTAVEILRSACSTF